MSEPARMLISAQKPVAADRWNLNMHHHRVIHTAIPPAAQTAIDVGCGDGLLSTELSARGLDVTALDLDAAVIDRTRIEQGDATDITFVHGNLLEPDLELPHETFDVVASVAMLHHVDAVAGLRALRRLVSLKGVLVVVGFALVARPVELGLAAAGSLLKRVQIMRGRYWQHSAPIHWPPPLSFSEMATIVERELPGAHFQRLLGGRYAIVWHARNTHYLPGESALL